MARLVRRAAALALAAAPLATLTAWARGPARPVAEAGATDASRGAEVRAPASPSAAIPPDPPPLRERAQYLIDLRWVRGDVYLVSMTREDAAEPRVTPRALGRFALELYEGPTLVERARFDFPLLGADEPDSGPRLSTKLSTRIGVLFPATSRGTRLELWDRATDTRWDLPWPYVAARDAGAPGDR